MIRFSILPSYALLHVSHGKDSTVFYSVEFHVLRRENFV